MPFLDGLFGKSENPIRRQVKIVIRRDRKGRARHDIVEGEAHLPSGIGGIDSIVVENEGFHNCGDSLKIPTGGQCHECGATSCIACFPKTRCLDGCLKPLCMEHLRRPLTETGARLSLCRNCNGEFLRQQRRAAIRRALFHPIKTMRGARD